MKRLLATILAMIMACSLVACGEKEATDTPDPSADPAPVADTGKWALETKITSTDKVTIRISHDTSDTQPSHVVLEEAFKAPLEAASNGNITVEIYPNSMLGSLTENVNSIQLGDLEMAYLNDSILSGFIPEFAVVGMPFLFSGTEAVHNAMEGDFGDHMNALLEEGLGIVNLGWCDVGFRNITNSSKPITSPDDLKGMKIRTMTNPLHLEYFEACGALPTPMAFNELYTALQQKTVDGEENPNAIVWNNNIWEVQSYMTISEHIWTSTALSIGKAFLESLPQDYQDAIREAGAQTAAYQREMTTEQNASLAANIAGKGVEVTELTAEQKAAFMKVAEDTVYKTAAKNYGQDLIDLAAAYNQ